MLLSKGKFFLIKHIGCKSKLVNIKGGFNNDISDQPHILEMPIS